MTKKCKICGIEKDVNEFYKGSNKQDRHSPYCKPCQIIYAREWRKRNPEKTYKEHRRKYQRIYQKNHLEVYKRNNKKWITNNPDRQWAIMSLASHRARGFVVKITLPQAIELLYKNPVCPICGKDLVLQQGKGQVARNSPTLDRINNEKHMDTSNVMILCHHCNRLKNKTPLAEFLAKRNKSAQ